LIFHLDSNIQCFFSKIFPRENLRFLKKEINIFIQKIIKKISTKIVKKLPKSLTAGFQSTLQETGQIPDCGFYLPVSMFWNDPVLGTRYTTDVVAGYPGTTWEFLVNCTVVFFLTMVFGRIYSLFQTCGQFPANLQANLQAARKVVPSTEINFNRN